jgi:hypothetical protein
VPRTKLTELDLKRELDDFRERFPKLADDQLFVVWFLRAFVTDDETQAVKALAGGSKDKGIDAILVDDDAKVVVLAQGKYRAKSGRKNEHRADVTSFAQLACDLTGDKETFRSLCDDLLPETEQRLTKARHRILKDHYRVQLYYVTLGRCSVSLVKEAESIVRGADSPSMINFLDAARVLLLLSDYMDGVAPPVPSLDLEMETGSGAEIKGIFHRYDHTTDIESWVFSMTARSVADLYAQSGNRLFARNVRGFLGSTEINRGMETTLKKEPEHFWYYNNGITIVCDEAEKASSHGRDILRVTNPQVINGQQTTRTLARFAEQGTRASVSVRVIRVPRNGNGPPDHFELLVSQIVSATNWQNAIRPSDLMSNDRRQIEIERQLRKLGYWYIRKRQNKSEARRAAGNQRYYLISKEALAQAVAACELDPAVVREGKEGLFEERLYSQVFPNADPHFYLPRYMLMGEVSYAARGYPERAYAKWLVLHFVWAQLAPSMRSRASVDRFRHAWEKGSWALNALWKANNSVFRAALQFYRENRGKGAKAADVSTFFKRRNLDRQFERFWRSSANKSRAQFQNAFKQFERGLVQD